MSTDYAGKEQAFLESLKADTGRDLGEWMAVVDAQKLVDRNEIIDWLRHQGFIFSWASWLERIHHNSGRPIYLSEAPPNRPADEAVKRPALRLVSSNPNSPVACPDGNARKPATISPVTHSARGRGSGPSRFRVVTPARADDGSGSANVERPQFQSAPAATGNTAGTNASAVASVVAKAKAFSPLARHLLTEIPGVVPSVTLRASGRVVSLQNPGVFAAVVMNPKGLRLCLDLGDMEFGERLVKTRSPSPIVRLPDELTHMVVLDDARQVDNWLIGLIRAANLRVNA